MRAGWFGDRYDRLKWSVVLRLTEPEQTILYVVMLRETDETERSQKSYEPKVVTFFRSIEAPTAKPPLERIVELDPRIRLFADRLPDTGEERHEYFQRVLDLVRQSERGSLCVFCDPDTGIALKPSGKHITFGEIRGIWGSMRARDRLVVYQHGWRPVGGDWHSIAEAKFADALGLTSDRVVQQPNSKTNVAFLTAIKN